MFQCFRAVCRTGGPRVRPACGDSLGDGKIANEIKVEQASTVNCAVEAKLLIRAVGVADELAPA